MSSLVDITATTADRPPVLDDRALFGHPRGLGLLFATEMWERFSFYGMRALLFLLGVGFVSLLMGAWFMAQAVAEKVAGWIAGFTPMPGEPARRVTSGFGAFIGHVSATHYGFFSIFLVSSFAAALVMLLFVPLLKRLTASAKA